MSKKFYIWKDPACAGVDIEWLEVSANKFFSLLKLPENKFRRFIRLGNDISMEADIIYIEATEKQYWEWRREQNAHDHIRRINSAYENVSLDLPAGEKEVSSLGEVIPDPEVDVEGQALAKIFHEAPGRYFGQLSEDEHQFLADLYIKGKTMVEMAAERGVSQPAITKRHKRLLERLKKYF
jgi:DNA-directed RNA polymerase specialized sigma subunit